MGSGGGMDAHNIHVSNNYGPGDVDEPEPGDMQEYDPREDDPAELAARARDLDEWAADSAAECLQMEVERRLDERQCSLKTLKLITILLDWEERNYNGETGESLPGNVG